MKFSIDSKAFLNRLIAASKAMNAKPVISIMSYFKISVVDGVLSVSAVGADATVVSRMAVDDSVGNGALCVEGKRLIEILKVMPGGSVKFEIDDTLHSITIRHGKGKYNIMGLGAGDFPEGRDINNETSLGTFVIPASGIMRALDRVSYAVCLDELHPNMMGVFWRVDDAAITFVATDTRVLAKYRSTQTAPAVKMEFTLPGCVLPLVRAFANRNDAVRVTADEKSITFEADDFRITTARVQGRYPDFDRVIPKDNGNVITANREYLLNAISRVAVCADAQAAKAVFKFNRGYIEIVAQDLSFNVGGEERIACDYDGAPITIAFNAFLVKKAIESIASANVVFKIKSQSTPAIMLPSENDEFGELTTLCMPMFMGDYA